MPLQRAHVDFAGPFMENRFMIVVDAQSECVEAIIL